MSEILEIYNLDWEYLYDMNRKQFYDESFLEFKNKWEVSRKTKRVSIITMDNLGKILFQWRSEDKRQNWWMIDKSVWWNVVKWDSYDETAIKESAEEVWAEAKIVGNIDLVINSHPKDNEMILTKIDYIDTFYSKRKISECRHIQPFMQTSYLWRYNWTPTYEDWEVVSFLKLTKEEFEEKLVKEKLIFTEDIKEMLEQYRDKLDSLLSTII